MALWNGRFKSRLDPPAVRFSSSPGVDRRLFREDIEGSIAHVTMLARRKILTKKESSVIVRALGQIRKEIEEGKFAPGGGRRFEAEDIHMAIESRLIEKTGATGGKLHTARSRNDQIAFDERLKGDLVVAAPGGVKLSAGAATTRSPLMNASTSARQSTRR